LQYRLQPLLGREIQKRKMLRRRRFHTELLASRNLHNTCQHSLLQDLIVTSQHVKNQHRQITQQHVAQPSEDLI